jgi:hypothetical protein
MLRANQRYFAPSAAFGAIVIADDSPPNLNHSLLDNEDRRAPLRSNPNPFQPAGGFHLTHNV